MQRRRRAVLGRKVRRNRCSERMWEGIRAIMALFCDLQSARQQLFRQLAQVIDPLLFF